MSGGVRETGISEGDSGPTSGGPGLPGRDVFGTGSSAGAARVLEAEVKERFAAKPAPWS